MEKRDFRELLEIQWDRGHFVCVGLDSNHDRIPLIMRRRSISETIVAFNQAIVDQTKDLVCAYKPNSAFYEAWGVQGLAALEETITYINAVAPEVPVILDAKRADIGNTNKGYAEAAFELLSADAITVHPYMGRESLQPFLDYKDKGIIILCRTSNPGAGEFQDLRVGDGKPLYQCVARQIAAEWNENNNCAVVVGATYPEELGLVREIVGNMPILIPGVGTQGGDVEKVVRAGKDDRGKGIIVNSSSGIIFASPEANFAKWARQQVIVLNTKINQYL